MISKNNYNNYIKSKYYTPYHVKSQESQLVPRAQQQIISGSITIGRMAPDFMALSTQGYIRLSDYIGKWLILSSNPYAFGPVSTTEIINTALLYDEFQKRNADILFLTTDNNPANLAWVYDIYQKTGIEIPFPIISDSDYKISDLYGMVSPDRLYGETVRSTFIINPYGRIKSILTYPIYTGRNTYSLLRILDSLQLDELYNVSTPADWQPGDPIVLKIPNTVEEMKARAEMANNLRLNCPFWYLCYENLDENITNENNIQ